MSANKSRYRRLHRAAPLHRCTDAMMAWPHASTVWCDDWACGSAILEACLQHRLGAFASRPCSLYRPQSLLGLAPGSRDLAMLPRPRLRNGQPGLDQVDRAIAQEGGRRPGRVGAASQPASSCNHHAYLLLHPYRCRPHSLAAGPGGQDGKTAARCCSLLARCTLPRLGGLGVSSSGSQTLILHPPNICQTQYKTDQRSASLASTLWQQAKQP